MISGDRIASGGMTRKVGGALVASRGKVQGVNGGILYIFKREIMRLVTRVSVIMSLRTEVD